MFNYELSHYIQKYKRRIIIISGVILLAIIIISIAYSLYLAHIHAGKLAVPMKIVPNDASVTLKDGTRLSGSTIYLTPGKHTLIIKKDGFTTVEKQYLIEDYNQPAVYVGLVGKSDEAKKWQQQHQRDYQDLELLGRVQAAAYGEAFRARNPIIKILPIKDPYFTISYRNVDDESVRLTIWGTSPKYREFALEYLRQKGFEPTDYEIEFDGFKNPLGDTK